MNHGRVFCGITRPRRMLVPRWGIVLAAAFWAAAMATFAEAGEGSLKEVYEGAQQHAQTSEGLETAMAEYRSVVEIHLANEDLCQLALRRLAEGYRESGRVEEGMRFFIGLVQKMKESGRQEVLRDIFAGFRLKHPELLEKVMAEIQGRAGPKPVVPAASSSRHLAQAILQRDDPQLRQEALQKLRKMLSAESDTEKKTALATLLSSLTAKFNRDPFLPLVIPLLKSDNAQIRALALRSLAGLEATPGDLAHVIPLAEDASEQVRMNVGGALIQIAKGDHREEVVPALMKLLQDANSKVVEKTVRSMWGQYSTPEFDELLIELSRRPRYHHNVIYFCLSSMREKSVAVCRRLVDELDDPDWNNSGRAAWGLTYGVPEEAESLVEQGLLEALPEETNPYTRKQEFRALRGVATEKSRPHLESVVESELDTEEFKQMAREILADLNRKE